MKPAARSVARTISHSKVFWMALLAASGFLAGALAGVPEPSGHAVSSTPISHGDIVTYFFSAYTSSGEPILTNSPLLGMELNLTSRLPINHSRLTAFRHVIGSESPEFLHVDLDRLFIGRAVGEHFRTPVIPANQTFTGLDGERRTLNRTAGPFPIREIVGYADFRERFPNATVGSTLQLNARFGAIVEAINETAVVYRIVVSDGQVFPYPPLGPNATITSYLLPSTTEFIDVLTVPPHSLFKRSNDQVFNITAGVWYVEEVSEPQISIAKVRSPDLRLALEDVVLAFELVNVEKNRR